MDKNGGDIMFSPVHFYNTVKPMIKVPFNASVALILAIVIVELPLPAVALN